MKCFKLKPRIRCKVERPGMEPACVSACNLASSVYLRVRAIYHCNGPGPIITKIKIVILFQYRADNAFIVLWRHKSTGEGCIEDCRDGRQKGMLGLPFLTLRLSIS